MHDFELLSSRQSVLFDYLSYCHCMGQTSLIGACTQGRPGQHPFSILAILFLSAKQRHVQAKADDMDGIQCLKAQLNTSSFRNNPEVLTAYVR